MDWPSPRAGAAKRKKSGSLLPAAAACPMGVPYAAYLRAYSFVMPVRELVTEKLPVADATTFR